MTGTDAAPRARQFSSDKMEDGRDEEMFANVKEREEKVFAAAFSDKVEEEESFMILSRSDRLPVWQSQVHCVCNYG